MICFIKILSIVIGIIVAMLYMLVTGDIATVIVIINTIFIFLIVLKLYEH